MKQKFECPIPETKYDDTLRDIKLDNNGNYTATYKGGETKCPTSKEVAEIIISSQTYFLFSHGKKPVAYKAISDVKTLLPCGLYEKVTPLFDADETKTYLSWLLNGLRYFTNKWCRRIEIANSIGRMAYMLYEPYENSDIKDIHMAFLNLITVGTCVFQFSNKPLSRSLYIGMYDVWKVAKATHNRYFYNEEHDWCNAKCFDDLMQCKDVFNNPLRDKYQYPLNLDTYSIDNIIFSLTALHTVEKANEGRHFLSNTELDEISSAKEAARQFLNNAVPHYKTLFTSLRADFRLGKGSIPIYCDYEKEPCKASQALYDKYFPRLGSKESGKVNPARIPYLVYTWNIFCQYESPIIKADELASSITGKSKRSLCLDTPILGERNEIELRKRQQDEFISKSLRFTWVLLKIGIAVAIAMLISSALKAIWVGIGGGVIMAFLLLFGLPGYAISKYNGDPLYYSALFMYWDTFHID